MKRFLTIVASTLLLVGVAAAPTAAQDSPFAHAVPNGWLRGGLDLDSWQAQALPLANQLWTLGDTDADRYGPATVRVEQGDYVRPMNRFNDPQPFYGGNRIASAPGVFVDGSTGFVACTSGFGGRSAGNGADYVLTAYHCAKPGDPRFWTTNEAGDGQHFIGTASVLDAGHDMAYVRSSTIPRVWDGPIHPYDAQFTKQVTAMAKPAPGARICTSGSFSGAQCYATIRGGGHFTLCGEWSGQGCWDVYLWYADADDWKSMCQPGDSGGPVFTPTGSTVTAIGIISGGTSSCSRVYFPDIYTEAWLNHQIDLTQ